ncbi:MAG: hypothetical protein ACD_39C01150G0001, partial [uncultured bacterium]
MSENPESEALQVHLVWWYWFGMLLCLIFTLGVGTLVMWWTARYRYPRFIDSVGIVKRDGKRLFWKDLSSSQQIRVENQKGNRISGAIDLHFGNETVKINPYVFSEGFHVLEFIRKVSGRSL